MKLGKIDSAFDKGIARDVAYMIATSHEYKKPNEDAAIKLVSNYNWEKRTMDISKIQGINKPVDKEKVFNISKNIKASTMAPLMVVDKFQGITPQSKGKKILLDGHHRLEACEFKGIKDVPVYYGRYTGGAEKSVGELIEKKANDILSSFEKNASKGKSPFQKLKDNEVKLTPEERKKVMESKAVWHFNGRGPSPAVWKSVDDKTGETTYVTHTHRAYNTAPTLKGAISRFHNFIKSTASENSDTQIEKIASEILKGVIK